MRTNLRGSSTCARANGSVKISASNRDESLFWKSRLTDSDAYTLCWKYLGCPHAGGVVSLGGNVLIVDFIAERNP